MLKQKDFEIYRETDALRPKAPTQSWDEQGRHIELREVRNMTFTEVRGEERIEISDESCQETRQEGGRKVVEPKVSQWRWMATDELAAYGPRVIHTDLRNRWESVSTGAQTHCFHSERCIPSSNIILDTGHYMAPSDRRTKFPGGS
ncbi:MAG: hypothetical protein EXS36_11155 [Pedosphaera sp.]|nr:hypothetical protein [Pedosphaera sp.]